MSNILKMERPVPSEEMEVGNTGVRAKKPVCNEGYWCGFTFQCIEVQEQIQT